MISSFPSRLMIALLFVLQLLPLQTNGKVWYQHVQDMHSVFGSGFGRSEKYSDIDEMFKGITNLMDRREENLSEQLKQIAPKFSEGNYGHRIYFHWGFNGRPEDSTALSERIKAATDDMQVREALFDKIRSVQRQRNQKTMLYVQICCLNPNDRSKALNGREMNAIAASVLGGTSMAGGIGNIGGTIVGAFVIGVINDGMTMCGVTEFYQKVIRGIVIILAVIIDQVQRNLQAKMALQARNENK